MKNEIEFVRIKNDVYGNPRYVTHFFELLTKDEKMSDVSIFEKYKIACKRANTIGGKKYNGKDFGGGIVFQSYNIDDTAERIADLVENSKSDLE